ncbi:hypothetical protein [Bradyrhizobium neotropicale]|uniref:hypothetical protein n=1 Tax=Bradyrhizobium neotropicale TaxID=1497615 RepID=UPI001AD72190|nr:hypothetical protein [Bradyrhizobium neotropicale]MBO4227735.1 hypothetical protein [Bradyrhizobium neotropicale]
MLLKGILYQSFLVFSMTFVDFIAACFWPLVVLFGLLLAIVKNPALFRYLLAWAGGLSVFYLGAYFFYGKSSIIAIVDVYVLGAVLGIAAVGCAYSRWRYDRRTVQAADFKEKLSWVGLFLVGLAMVWISATTLFADFFQPRLVLEGRVTKLRTEGRLPRPGLADIAGRTVKATTPVYERLKFKPYVRVEVGRGSNYIFQIEYLSD